MLVKIPNVEIQGEQVIDSGQCPHQREHAVCSFGDESKWVSCWPAETPLKRDTTKERKACLTEMELS